MEIIPVIDILNGVVVHAKKGEREKYKPLKSVICGNNNPLTVAQAFQEIFRFRKFYIADLDAITKGEINYKTYKKIVSETSFQTIMVDAGVNKVEKANKLLETGVSKVIIGTETLKNIKDLEKILGVIGKERVILSIDLMRNKVVSGCKAWKEKNPLEISYQIEELGVEKVILLELSKVGSEEGVPYQPIKEFVENTSFKVLTGGGVRDLEDLKKLEEIGVEGVLIATAIHKGTLKPADFLKLKTFQVKKMNSERELPHL